MWSSATFSITVLCRTMSNAFETSRAKTRTYVLADSMVDTMWRRATIDATVEPVGLNANWSAKTSLWLGCWLDCRVDEWSDYESLKCPWQYGCNVIEIGLKSAGCAGCFTLGTGVIMAVFHWLGTISAMIDWLIKQLCDRCRKNRGSQSQEPSGWYSIQACSWSFQTS